MGKNIKAKIIADSLSPQGNRLTTFVLTFPRIVHAELMTHRMFSRNAASSRAVPVKKMIESVKANMFIPLAIQKSHSGMQGSEYLEGEELQQATNLWIESAELALQQAEKMEKLGITKQLINRILEPYQYYTVILTTSEEGLENFFKQRCPVYDAIKGETFRSKKDAIKYYPDWNNATEIDWLIANSGQAEIHISLLAEYMWDAYNQSTPRQLQVGDWHIPFLSEIDSDDVVYATISGKPAQVKESDEDSITLGYEVNITDLEMSAVKIATARAARISYTVVGEDKQHSYEDDLKLHDRLIAMYHLSPLEHICRAMSDKEYETFVKGEQSESAGVKWAGTDIQGWCSNLRGFIPYRYMIESK